MPASETDRASRQHWQQLLTTYLTTGDEFKTERAKLADGGEHSDNVRLQLAMKSDTLWLELKFHACELSADELKQRIAEWRSQLTIKAERVIMDFQVRQDTHAEIVEALSAVDQLEQLFPSVAAMRQSVPLVKSPIYVNRVEALRAWLNVEQLLVTQAKLLAKWVGMTSLTDPIPVSFVETVLREQGLQATFESKLIRQTVVIIKKSHDAFTTYGRLF